MLRCLLSLLFQLLQSLRELKAPLLPLLLKGSDLAVGCDLLQLQLLGFLAQLLQLQCSLIASLWAVLQQVLLQLLLLLLTAASVRRDALSRY